MPKHNVYIPDILHQKCQELHIPVSTVCQKALWEEVRKVDGGARGCSSKGCKGKVEWLVQAEGYPAEYVCSTHLAVVLVTDGQSIVRGIAS